MNVCCGKCNGQSQVKREGTGSLEDRPTASLDKVGKWNVPVPEMGYRKTFMSARQTNGRSQIAWKRRGTLGS